MILFTFTFLTKPRSNKKFALVIKINFGIEDKTVSSGNLEKDFGYIFFKAERSLT